MFPKGEVYVSLLPPEARNLLGRVGKETEPAKRLLERLGFRYEGQIDPFDAGPYLEANANDIELVTTTNQCKFKDTAEDITDMGFVSAHDQSGFRALRTEVSLSGNDLSVSKKAAEILKIEPGASLGFTPLPKSKSAKGQK